MRVIRFSVFVITICSIMGCQLLSSDKGESIVQVTTGNQEYLLTDSSMIDLSIKNVSSSTIYYNKCDSRTIEEIENGSVTQSIVFTNPCECLCIISIQPNEEKELNINGYFLSQQKEKLKLTKDFKYRILPHFYEDKEQRKQISKKTIKSNRFILVSK